MSARSAQLGFANVVAGAFVTLATVPAGETWIAKSVLAFNAAGLGGPVRVQIVDPTNAISVMLFDNNADNRGRCEWEGWAVATPGCTIQAQTVGGTFGILVSGARLLGTV